MSEVCFRSRTEVRRGRRALLPVLVLGACTLSFSCKSDTPPSDSPPTENRLFQAPQDDIESLTYNPSFEPDFNNLTPQPWVEPATQAQTDDVSVFPDRIEFPSSHTEVLAWSPGRIVVAAPGKGAGRNGLGFARKVSSVAQSGDKIVVMTVAPAIEEILQGDFRMKFDPDSAQVVDLSKVDAQWVADNLYVQTPDVEHMPGELLTDNHPPDTAPMGFFSKITKTVAKAATSVAKAVATATKDVYQAITPATLNVSGGIKPEIKFGSKIKLPLLKGFKHSFKTSGGYETELTMNADFSYDINVTLNSGVQMSGKIGVPGRGASSQMALSFDALAKWQTKMDMTLESAISSVDGNVGDDLVDFLNKKLTNQELLYADVREKQMGDPNLKPSASWKKTLWMSAPMTQTLLAGVVPVVFTETLQVDLECGFEAKASLTAHAELAQAATIKFKAEYDTGTNKATLTGPTLQNKFTTEVNVLGQGSAMVTCGLVPRVNAFLYDMVGVFAGVRGSVVAKGEYVSECTGASGWPEGKVGFNLSADLGVQVGGRLQAPGASIFGIAGQVAGLNVGPLEPFKLEIPLYKGEWKFKRGLGWCSTSCKDQVFNGSETDLDCGGGCEPCTLGKRCAENTDCKGSFCSDDRCGPDTCSDKVQDGEETDIDCGGKCKPCQAGKDCETGEDCDSGACGGKTSARPGVCVADHCTDKTRNKDEDGVDCGGQDCAKCADGTVVTRAESCLSGLWNGRTCVASTCTDNVKGGDEGDRDCGGSCPARCGFGQGCAASADCAGGLACQSARSVCLRAAGMACSASGDCQSNNCQGGTCSACPIGVELLVNPDAEAGPAAPDQGTAVTVPGWTTTTGHTVIAYGAAGGFPGLTDPGPAQRGKNFFSGGNVTPSIASQSVDISACSAAIDAGSLKFDLSGYLGGFETQDDNAVVVADFRSGAGSLGTVTIGPVRASDRGNVTGLLLRQGALATVPSGARTLVVTMTSTRTGGVGNDGFVDNLSARFSSK